MFIPGHISHQRSQPLNFWKQKSCFLNLAGAPPQITGWGVARLAGKILWHAGSFPFKAMYHMTGGPLWSEAITIPVKAVLDAKEWTRKGREVVQEGAYIGGYTALEAAKGIGMAGIIGPARFALGGPALTVKESVWDTGRESIETMIQAVQSPVRLGMGMRDAVFGTLSNIVNMPWKTLKGDFSGAWNEAKMVIPNLTAPVHKPVAPVAKQAAKTIKTALWAYKQNIDGFPAGLNLSRAGVNMVLNSFNVGKVKGSAAAEASRDAKVEAIHELNNGKKAAH